MKGCSRCWLPIWTQLDVIGGASAQQDQQETTPTMATDSAQPGDARMNGTQDGLSFGQIANNPGQYAGQSVTATGFVSELDTDRGFWLLSDQQGEERLFVLLSQNLDTPDPRTDVNDGDTVQLTGTVLDARAPENIEQLKPVWDEAGQILEEEPAFIRVTEVTFVESQQAGDRQRAQVAGRG